MTLADPPLAATAIAAAARISIKMPSSLLDHRNSNPGHLRLMRGLAAGEPA